MGRPRYVGAPFFCTSEDLCGIFDDGFSMCRLTTNNDNSHV